jgi:DNA-binding beta-propeller fold protein YncE
VISGQTNTVTATIPVGQVPGGVATNPQTNTVYVANIGSSSVSVVRT